MAAAPSLAFAVGVASGGRLSDEEVEKRRNICTKASLDELTSSAEFKAWERDRKVAGRHIAAQRQATFAASLATLLLLVLALRGLSVPGSSVKTPAAVGAGLTRPKPSEEVINVLKDTGTVQLLQPLDAAPAPAALPTHELLSMHATTALGGDMLGVEGAALYNLAPFLSAAQLAAHLLLAAFVAWSLVQLAHRRLMRRGGAHVADQGNEALGLGSPGGAGREPLYGQLLILQAELSRKHRELQAAHQAAYDYEACNEELRSEAAHLREAAERAGQAKAKLESELLAATQQLEVMRSISASLDGQVEQLVADQVKGLFDTPAKPGSRRGGLTVDLGELKSKLEAAIAHRLELQAELAAAQEALEEKDARLAEEAAKAREMEGRLRAVSGQLAAFKGDAGNLVSRARFPRSPSPQPESPAGSYGSPASPHTALARARSAGTPGPETEREGLLFALSNADEERRRAEACVLRLQTQLQGLQQQRVALEQAVEERELTIAHLRAALSQAKEQGRGRGLMVLMAEGSGDDEVLRLASNSEASSPASGSEGGSDKENVVEACVLTPVSASPGQRPRGFGRKGSGVEIGEVAALQGRVKALQAEVANAAAAVAAAQREGGRAKERAAAAEARAAEAEAAMADAKAERDAAARQGVQVPCLMAQVEQLEGELAHCLADKNEAEARAREAEQAQLVLSALLERAQEQTAAILNEFASGNAGSGEYVLGVGEDDGEMDYGAMMGGGGDGQAPLEAVVSPCCPPAASGEPGEAHGGGATPRREPGTVDCALAEYFSTRIERVQRRLAGQPSPVPNKAVGRASAVLLEQQHAKAQELTGGGSPAGDRIVAMVGRVAAKLGEVEVLLQCLRAAPPPRCEGGSGGGSQASTPQAGSRTGTPRCAEQSASASRHPGPAGTLTLHLPINPYEGVGLGYAFHSPLTAGWGPRAPSPPLSLLNDRSDSRDAPAFTPMDSPALRDERAKDLSNAQQGLASARSDEAALSRQLADLEACLQKRQERILAGSSTGASPCMSENSEAYETTGAGTATGGSTGTLQRPATAACESPLALLHARGALQQQHSAAKARSHVAAQRVALLEGQLSGGAGSAPASA